MKYRAIALYCLMGVTNIALGQSEAVSTVCKQMENMSAPSEDKPTAAIANTLKNCDAEDLYYGFTTGKPDFVKSRYCALMNPDKDGHYDILTMIYANGRGVARNIDLAIHFACKGGFAPAEMSGRVEHLLELKKTNWTGSDFDICDDITSGYMMGVCASHEKKLSSPKQAKDIASISQEWNDQSKQQFAKLKIAADQFIKLRSANEIDLSGTARAALQLDEEKTLTEDFVVAVEFAERGKVPTYTADDFKKADHQLNELYQRIQTNKNNPKLLHSTITHEGIKKTQRAWIKYRDAWASFGAAKYPSVKSESWKTWLTKKRIEMLRKLI